MRIAMEPEISELYSDLNKWARENRYVPNASEVSMLADCTRRVRKYASCGLLAGGLSAWGVVKMLEGRAPINRMQKGIWILSGCLVGAGMATSVAGMHSMKQLVEMPDSPIADVARQIILQRKEKFPDAAMYIALFPPQHNEWGDSALSLEAWQCTGASQHMLSDSEGQQEKSWGSLNDRLAKIGDPAPILGREGSGNYWSGLADDSHARRLAAMGRSDPGQYQAAQDHRQEGNGNG